MRIMRTTINAGIAGVLSLLAIIGLAVLLAGSSNPTAVAQVDPDPLPPPTPTPEPLHNGVHTATGCVNLRAATSSEYMGEIYRNYGFQLAATALAAPDDLEHDWTTGSLKANYHPVNVWTDDPLPAETNRAVHSAQQYHQLYHGELNILERHTWLVYTPADLPGLSLLAAEGVRSYHYFAELNGYDWRAVPLGVRHSGRPHMALAVRKPACYHLIYQPSE